MSDSAPIDERAETGIFAQGMRLVWRSYRLRPFSHLLATVGAIAYSLASVALTIALGRLTDEVILDADGGVVDNSAIWLGAFALVLIGVARSASAMLRRWFLSRATYLTQRRWRTDLTDRYLDLPLSFHQRVPTGRLLAHVDTDVETATRMLMPLAFAISTGALAVFALISLGQISLWLLVVAVVLFPALALMNRVYTNLVAKPTVVERSKAGDVSTIAHESFDGALVVKTLGREGSEVARFRQASEELRDIRIGIFRRRAVFEPAIDSLPNIGIVILLAIGAWLVSTGTVTTGEIVQAMALFTILALPVRIVGFFLEEMPSSVAGLARIDRVLAEPVEVDGSASRTLPAGPLSLEFRNVGFSYEDDRTVIDDVSFAVGGGRSIALVGSTGSGKSTLGLLATRLIEADRGEIIVGGEPLHQLADDVRTDNLGIVFQDAFLFAATIRENVALGGDYSDAEIARALAVAQADGFVGDLDSGIDTVMGERGVTVSGGQRQRLALARAVVRRPRVLVLDDATSALDPSVERKVLDSLREGLDTTLVVIAYRLATIELADEVIYLADGKIAAHGPHDELMALPDYAALIRAYDDVGDD